MHWRVIIDVALIVREIVMRLVTTQGLSVQEYAQAERAVSRCIAALALCVGAILALLACHFGYQQSGMAGTKTVWLLAASSVPFFIVSMLFTLIYTDRS